MLGLAFGLLGRGKFKWYILAAVAAVFYSGALFMYGMTIGKSQNVLKNLQAKEAAEAALIETAEELSRAEFNRLQREAEIEQAFDEMQRRVEERGVGKTLVIPEAFYDELHRM